MLRRASPVPSLTIVRGLPRLRHGFQLSNCHIVVAPRRPGDGRRRQQHRPDRRPGVRGGPAPVRGGAPLLQCALHCRRDAPGDVEAIGIADVTCGVGNIPHNKDEEGGPVTKSKAENVDARKRRLRAHRRRAGGPGAGAVPPAARVAPPALGGTRLLLRRPELPNRPPPRACGTAVRKLERRELARGGRVRRGGRRRRGPPRWTSSSAGTSF